MQSQSNNQGLLGRDLSTLKPFAREQRTSSPDALRLGSWEASIARAVIKKLEGRG